MPSIIGAFKVVSNSGTINNGDSFITAPTQSSKTYNGSGTGITGDRANTFSFFSATITNDSDQIDDSPITVKGELSKYRRRLLGR